MFTDNFYPELGGIQDSILATVRELGARGHQIMLMAPSASHRDYARVGRAPTEPDLGPNVRICRLPSVHVPSSSQQSRLAIPTGSQWRRVAAFNPYIIHTHTFLGVGLEATRTARRLGLPLVGTNHWNVGAFDVYVPFGRAVFRRVSSRLVTRYYQKCNWVTAPSRFSLADMQAYGLSRPSSVVSNPIDTAQFRPVGPREKISLKARLKLGNSVVVYAGRLGKEKRIDVLIRAIAAARKHIPQISMVVAGHGSDKSRLEKLASELGLDRQIRFVGTLDHGRLAELFAAADVFAIASTSETQSMVLLQAMACGLPVVGAQSGGLSEHIPGSVGRQVNADDPTEVAEQLTAILSCPQMQAQMGCAARSFVQTFSVPSIADAWEAIYTRLTSTDPSVASRLRPLNKTSERNHSCA